MRLFSLVTRLCEQGGKGVKATGQPLVSLGKSAGRAVHRLFSEYLPNIAAVQVLTALAEAWLAGQQPVARSVEYSSG
jgi:hypothetical protein